MNTVLNGCQRLTQSCMVVTRFSYHKFFADSKAFAAERARLAKRLHEVHSQAIFATQRMLDGQDSINPE